MANDEGQYHRWQHELARRDAERAHDRADMQHGQALTNTLTAAQAVIRYTMLINGGAAVALLAFIGALVTRAELESIRSLAGTLVWFACGVVFCGVAYSAAYLALMAATRHFVQHDRLWSHPWVEPKHNRWHHFSSICEWVAMIATAASIAAFAVGVLDVRDAIKVLKIAAPQISPSPRGETHHLLFEKIDGFRCAQPILRSCSVHLSPHAGRGRPLREVKTGG